MNKIVCKFGGTSLANSQNIKKVKEIVLNGNKPYVVVSAPGKREKADTKITDCLINAFKKSQNGENYQEEINFFINRYEEIKKAFNLDIDLTTEFKELERAIKEHEDYDYVVSRGEYFSAKSIALILNYSFLDATFIIFDDNGNVDLDITKQNFLNLTNPNEKYVIPGFYGLTLNHKIKTFSRGGSDITGAIVSAVSGAKTYENWTDVDGFLTADPKLCENPKLIKELNYHELRELSYMGANVLHPECAKFLKENNIILNLRNTFNPTCTGSLIKPDDQEINQESLTGIAGQKGFTIFNIEKFDLNESLGIIEKVANIFKNNKISIEHIPTGIDSVSVIVKSSFLTDETKQKILSEITTKIKPDKLEIIEKVALICVVGKILNEEKIAEQKVYKALYSLNENIITLNKGANGISVIFGIFENVFDTTINQLYKSLF